MNFYEIENLVSRSKAGDNEAKEALVAEFTPLIINLVKKSFVSGYEFEDLKNECYKTLFNCIRLYDLNQHRFVAYATNGIKNSLNYLIRSRAHSDKNIPTLTLTPTLEEFLPSNEDLLEETFIKKSSINQLRTILSTLPPHEKELIKSLYYNNNSLRQYASQKGLTYGKAVTIKNNLLKKIKNQLL